jgi:predicted AlkP superfamily pyrophosphatase or phosphodiesterase
MRTAICRRVVLVVLDGLRPDAIDVFGLSHVRTLQAAGAWTHSARTVTPSVTAAAIGSLLTGVHPADHGLTSDRFHIPRSNACVTPLPATLREAGLVTSAFLAQPPLLFRRMARALAERLGVDRPVFVGQSATDIVREAAVNIETQQIGLVFVHLPDADRAGHAHGWMSPRYGDACRDLDEAVGVLRHAALSENAHDTLLIVCADHGGGGLVHDNHESTHPLDCTIPIILAGAGVRAGTPLGNASILDVPVTVLDALGLPVPASYVGQPLHRAVVAEYAAA